MTSEPLPIELVAYRIMAETGLSARELAEMDMDAYARLTGRATVSEIASKAHDYTPPSAQRAPAPAQAAPDAPQQPDVAAMDWEQYSQWREASGLAQRSAEGMSRASLSIASRFERSSTPPAGRTTFYRGQ